MEPSEGDSVRNRWYLPAAATVAIAALASRFFRLADWSLAGDEMYTLGDSLSPGFSLVAKPLLFWLNHLLIGPTVGFDEFGLRLLPALFGVAGVLAVMEVGRRMTSELTAVAAGVFTVLSPWHLFWSQNARYYSLVFLLAVLAAGGLYLGIKTSRRSWTILGIVCAVLGYFAHATAVLPVCGVIAWYLVRSIASDRSRLDWVHAGLLTLVLLAFGLLGLRVLSSWTDLEQTWGIGGLDLMASFVIRLGPGVAIACAGGLLLLWLKGRKDLAGFLAAAIAVPVIVLGLLGKIVAVHTAYMFAAAPFVLLTAGAFVEHVGMRSGSGVTRGVVIIGVGAAVAAGGMPSYVSHYLNGGRPNFEAAAEYMSTRVAENDIVVTDQPGTLNHYTDQMDVKPFARNTARLDSLYRSARSSSGVLWVVPYYHSSGGFSISGLEGAEGWVRDNCELSRRIGQVRIDHQRSYLYVWSCPGEEGVGADRGPTLGLERRSRTASTRRS